MYKTNIVKIGKTKIGENLPICVQSMTNTNSLDIDSTLNQIVNLANLGCEMIRVTVPGLSEVEALKLIYQKFRTLGYLNAIIADVHFNPKVAEECAKFVEKVRINPGNYVDKKKFKLIEYTDSEYNNELVRIEARLKPFIEICKAYNTAVRIGVNHGSLSDRIVNRYGNTALGMAMSAFEFTKIFHQNQFHNVVLSLKSSDVKTMVFANRIFLNMMRENSIFYPIHLGVTEAGEGEDGRIKSALGIGTLLLSDIGNTIRVSLTESPEKEIPVAKKIIEIAENSKSLINITSLPNITDYRRRKSISICNIGGENNIEIITKDFYTKNKKSIILFSDSLSVEPLENKIVKFDLTDANVLNKLYHFVENQKDSRPIIVSKQYITTQTNDYIIQATIDFGLYLIDGIIDGIEISNPNFPEEFNHKLAQNILQASGVRHFKAEIISCPSCGRTQFEIEKILKEAKASVSHLKELKIGIMGCVVNGPGEMADADYGLVGAGKGKLWLYKGQNVIQKNIDQKDAVDTLIQFLKQEHKWSDAGE